MGRWSGFGEVRGWKGVRNGGKGYDHGYEWSYTCFANQHLLSSDLLSVANGMIGIDDILSDFNIRPF